VAVRGILTEDAGRAKSTLADERPWLSPTVEGILTPWHIRRYHFGNFRIQELV